MQDPSRLRTQLEERRDRILRAHPNTVETEIGSLLRFIERNPLLVGALQALKDACQDFDAEAWIKEHFVGDGIDIPEAEPCRVRLYEALLRKAVADGSFIVSITRHQSRGQMPERIEVFNNTFVEPFVRLIDDKIEDGDYLLTLLDRYRREVIWFRQEELIALAEADTQRSEKALDKDLRRALFGMGLDYPFSQPASPSGKADVVVGGDDPKPIEVKLYDPSRDYYVDRLKTGVRQAYDYAGDFGSGAGYLVIFNFADRPLELPNDDEGQVWPPRLVVGNRTVYLVSVELGMPSEPASKRPPLGTISIARDDLVPEDLPAG